MAFNALIHKHRSDLIDYDNLQKSNALFNLKNAFDTAEDKLGLTKFLDPEGSRYIRFYLNSTIQT